MSALPENATLPARAFYFPRLAAAFACSRRFSEPLGQVAESVVVSEDFAAIVRECSIGSLEGARRIGELVVVRLDRTALSFPDSSPVAAAGARGWWRDLLNYERVCFLQAATTAEAPPANRPRRGLSALCMSFSWAVPELIACIHANQSFTAALQRPLTLLFSRKPDGQTGVVEVGSSVEKAFRATNGLRTLEQIAQAAGLDLAETHEILAALTGVGAIVPAMSSEKMLRALGEREK
jgi:hypothetical protein